MVGDVSVESEVFFKHSTDPNAHKHVCTLILMNTHMQLYTISTCERLSRLILEIDKVIFTDGG